MSFPRVHTREVAWAVVVAAVAGGAAWYASAALFPAITHVSTFDFWFESDAPAILNQLQDRDTLSNSRANRHPLFTLILFPLVAVLRLVAEPLTAVRLLYAALAAAWAVLFFLVLRGGGLRRGDAALFTALAMVSAAAVFWLPVPETFAPALLSTTAALAALVWHERTGRLTWGWCVLVAAATLSMTTTNAVVGFLVCVAVLGMRRGATAIAAAVLLVIAGQGVARLLFPRTAPFFLPLARESAYVFNALAGGLGDRLVAFFLSSIVLPLVNVGYAGYLSAQRVDLRAIPPAVSAAWGLWAGLLALGAVALVQQRTRMTVVLAGAIAWQLTLALVFGQETFVYALQFGPLLVMTAAFSALGRWRRAVLAATVVVVGLAAFENVRRFDEAASLLRQRYESASTFARAVSTLTRPTDLMIVGLPPAAAEGGQIVAGPPGAPRRPERLSRLPQFEAWPLTRQGWQLSYERWSPESLERLRRAGASYFVSEYAYGIQNHAGVQAYLEANGREQARTSQWVVYALAPAAPGAVP